MTQFEDRVAIVTGGSRGIGKALALALASRGTAVVVAKTMESDSRLPGSVPDTVREIEVRGGRALGLRCDVRNDADLKHVVDRTLERFGHVDILINNAGAMWIQSVEDTPQKRFDLMTSINFRAPFLLAHYCIPEMRRRKWGHIRRWSWDASFAPRGRRSLGSMRSSKHAYQRWLSREITTPRSSGCAMPSPRGSCAACPFARSGHAVQRAPGFNTMLETFLTAAERCRSDGGATHER